MDYRILNLGISSEQDMVAVRQRAREISGVLGFGAQDQVRIATAASELARTAFAFISGGNVEFLLDRLGSGASLLVRIRSAGELRDSPPPRRTEPLAEAGAAGALPGASALDAALLIARRLMDDCSIDNESGRGRVITLRKALPRNALCSAGTLATLTDHILASPVASSFSEVHLQNRELLETLAELRTRQDDLLSLTEELEKTNRGVVALYAEIEEKAERLRQADVYKDEFLATLAHELRNPLAPIRNAVEIMRRVDPSNVNSHARAQQIISRQVDHLARLVDDLLDVARISKGKITLQRMPIALSTFIHAAVETVQPFIDSRAHHLSVTLPDEPVMILGDAVRLAQMVGNLLNNAAKYTVRGGSIRIDAVLLPGERVRITVSDNGIGLSRERMGMVFGLFAQGDTAPDRAQDGLGIGLSLVRQLVALHGGEIAVDSAGPGQGSSFTMELPVLPAEALQTAASAGAATTPDPDAAVTGSLHTPLPPVRDGQADSGTGAEARADADAGTNFGVAAEADADAGAHVNADTEADANANADAGRKATAAVRILLVDDNADSVAMTAMLLESFGHTTFVAQDAGSAMAQAIAHLPGLVLLDIGLPGDDGYAIARMLRQQPDLHGVRLVAVTGYGTERDKQMALEAGFDHHLVKPVDLSDLMAVIDTL